VGVIGFPGGGVPAIFAGILRGPLVPRAAPRATFRASGGDAIDEGIALHFPAPRSYTGEDVLELHGHGGPAVLRLLLTRCTELGARLARPGEFTQRAFLNGKLDLAQAEGVADLIDAATATAARAAARSLSGAFSAEIRALVEALIELRMFIEATLDFPEEDVEFLRAADVRVRIEAIAARIAGVLARAKRGALLREGLMVVLVGRPNVGKSSLLNQLAGEDLAIVTPIAGTTRDALQSPVEIEGIPLTFIDTAGLRATDDPIETLGIDRTWAAVAKADLALVLVDATAGDDMSDADTSLLAQLPPGLPRLVVHNKIDLVGVSAAVAARSLPGGAGDSPMQCHVYLSAKTGEGVDLLRGEILGLAGVHEDMEDTFLARERHLDALRAATVHLDSALAHFAGARPPQELVAEDLRAAHTALALITGEFTSDDLLGVIFSRFCIGK
jgi:tRNA modification GTPase